MRVRITAIGWLLLLLVLALEGVLFFWLRERSVEWFGPPSRNNPGNFVSGIPFIFTPLFWWMSMRLANRFRWKAINITPP